MNAQAEIMPLSLSTPPLNPEDATPEEPAYVVTADTLLEFGRCPERLRHRLVEDEKSPSRHTQLVRQFMLAPHDYRQRIVVRPDTYQASVKKCPSCGSAGPGDSCTKCGTRRWTELAARPWTNAAAYCKAWSDQEHKKGHTPISRDHQNAVEAAALRLQGDDVIASVLDAQAGLVRVTGTYTDASTGLTIELAAEVDCVPPEGSVWDRCLASLVVVTDASTSAWERQAFYAGYHVRAAFALDLYNMATGQTRDTFLYLLSEAAAPYQPGRRLVTKDLILEGRRTYQALLTAFATARATQHWPGYDPSQQYLDAFTPFAYQPWMATKMPSYATGAGGVQPDSAGSGGSELAIPEPGDKAVPSGKAKPRARDTSKARPA